VRFRKEEKPLIQFVSTVPGLEDIEDIKPKLAKNFIPEWFKNTPLSSLGKGNIRDCPSFPDYFSQGYVIPMWTDSLLEYDPKTEIWKSQSSDQMPVWHFHSNDQLIDFVSPSFLGETTQFVFKAICPWRIITPPGWSVLQIPMIYHFNKDFSVMPGVIDTDIHHEINQQVMYHGNGKQVFIKRGTPLATYIPFKRTKHDSEVRYQTEQDNNLFLKNSIKLSTKILGEGGYRKLQKERDKGLS
jgi:hypothetical protein